ncbi:Endo-beta-1,3-glucanase [Pleurostoma richardsiae]|uniref:glucan endo-1,3-beta-D-glucosidase n=1 Tax=Pleurostoma richardsiae TaxID=41990 RepID=A0AA38RJ09_9PEZI|nr:Endo-beta-1,3-glucanase [Pleurostoma richardsiae]
MARHSFESDPDEREPLENAKPSYPEQSPSRHQRQYQQQPQRYQEQQYYTQDEPPQYDDLHQYPTSPARPPRPGSHPDSSFNRLRANRRYSREQPSTSRQAPYLAASAGAAVAAAAHRRDPVSPVSPPQPPPHRDVEGRYWGAELGYPVQQSNITPGADNFSEAAGGGMAGIAYSVAEQNARESGLEAVRGVPYTEEPYQAGSQRHLDSHYDHQPQQQHVIGEGSEQQYNAVLGGLHPSTHAGTNRGDTDSYSSLAALGAAAIPPAGARSPDMRTPSSRSPHSFNTDLYHDDPYQGYTGMPNPYLGVVNPNDIEDDGDEGLEYGKRGARTSMLSLGGSSNRSRQNGTSAAAAETAKAASAGGVLGALGGLVGRTSNGPAGNGQYYDPVHNIDTGYRGGGGGAHDLRRPEMEKPSEWLTKQNRSSRKWKWLILVGVGLAIAAGIACGVVFGVVKKNSGKSDSSSDQSASGDTTANGDLSINSSEIQKLLNNPDLHKVFPGVDYTPLNTQYPDCLRNPPSQNNITRDMAVLSQLTNTIRLYGTDCNQTEMTIHAIKRLEMEDTVKIWMGVWQDNNQTTNDRQLAQMWDILDTYGDSPFKGVIVANEILYRQQMTASELGQLLSSVRSNITAKGMSLPVATSDLGDALTAELVEQSDYVMANIHPFFGGVNAEDAASWTWTFWETHNGPFFKSDTSKNVISETGWPSQGGTDCGTTSITDCPDAAVAGIDELNQFMDDWVCAALTNGTEYFWFEAFDEPWKIQFDTGDQNWEDHWGLMDVNRNLKKGVKIPDCDGKTV